MLEIFSCFALYVNYYLTYYQMLKNTLWSNFVVRKSTLGKNNTEPAITDSFMTKILEESKEGKIPLFWDIPFSYYKGKRYTINTGGIIKDLNGHKMKYLFYPNKLWPRVRIKRDRKMINSDVIQSEYYEINIIKLIRKNFSHYIQGYKESSSDPKKFILIPKDGDWTNLAIQNLQFISKKCYQEKGSNKEKIKTILSIDPQISARKINHKTDISLSYISKVKGEMRDIGQLDSARELQNIRKQTGLKITQENFPLYQILLSSQGKLSNMEVAEHLRWKDFTQLKTNEEKRILTDKVVRARKKLTDKGIILRFNHNFEEKKEEAIKMLCDKENSWLTNFEIAIKLWLNKGQIDNLARKLKKK